ncbi:MULTISPECIES: hypothetical protein [unclassified Clostridium]|uniref:hypothetical protein n=1 Tax=unclassified Clostridium TaxID=2614128 RepID=UPI0013F87F36|nr:MULTISPECIES: hypothetical protein [unclassified Clostridium]MBN1038261.1 hypothetical protein [Clostridium botulinum]NFR86168.1 hypothetical protein [Clostridium botulinum]NFR88918.1 hypothetical protein [Clostridium botulinum]NFT98739.1 hypothetical protein [Clostridium botulinum]
MNILEQYMGNKDKIDLEMEELSEYITDLLGMEFRVGVEVTEDDHLKKLEVVTERDRFKTVYVKDDYAKVLKIIDEQIDGYRNNSFIHDIEGNINDIVMQLIFSNYKEFSIKEKIDLKRFIKLIQNISNLTYENKSVDMNIFLNLEKGNMRKLEGFFDCIALERKGLKEFIFSQKPLLKILDKKNYSLILDKDYYATYFLKRKFNQVNIEQYMNNMINNQEKSLFIKDLIRELKYLSNIKFKVNFVDSYIESINKTISEEAKEESRQAHSLLKKNERKINKIMNKFSKEIINNLTVEEKKIMNNDRYPIYILIQNNKIEFWNNNYYSLAKINSVWKIKNYVLLAHEIFAGIYLNPNNLFTDIDIISKNVFIDTIRNINNDCIYKEDINKTVIETINKIKVISSKIFKLIRVIKRLSMEKEGALFIIVTDMNLFKNNRSEIIVEETNDNFYKNINKGKCICDINDDDLEIIATVDGSILLDTKFNILTFGEMIKPQEIDKSRCGNIYGARTNAAVNASNFGISIKVSEDGDVSLYRKVIYKEKSITEKTVYI